ncbi:response regulator transcription factor [Paenibacillus hubeiensis]|uniref:response regulator transcription factor n=1 Tax=Paenibacillus hubeiensis TaxID=3077330 RepID=UPI0031BA6257
MKIRILLADDHTMVRRGLYLFLATQPDMEVVGEAADGLGALEQAGLLRPDVVLMDLHMPGLNGIEASARLRADVPESRIIVLTSFSDQDHVVPAVQAGVKGYLLKDIEPEQLAAAIRNVHAGKVELHPAAAEQIMHMLVSSEVPMNRAGSLPVQPNVQEAADFPAKPAMDSKEADHGLSLLTRREREVLALIAQGMNNRDIAARLVITEKTVKTHVSHLLDKLGLADRTQAAVLAVRNGWMD